MGQTWDEKGNLIQAQPTQASTPSPLPPTAKPKIKQSWDEHGKPIQATPQAKSTQTVEKAMPFSSGVVSGMMLDPTKIAQQKDTVGQVKEVGKQMLGGTTDWLKKVAMDPLHVGDPIDAIVKGQQDAYKDVHEGLKTGNHDQLMHGLGLAVGNLSTVLGGAKSAKEGFGVTSTAKDASFAAKDLTSKRAIVSAASHGALDALKDEHSQALDTAVKAERTRIGGAVASINMKDVKADPNGYVPQKLALATLDQAVSDKKANVLLNKRMLPKVSQVRGLLEGHAQNLTFNDLKQVRSVVGDALGKATGVERAVLGDYYNSLSNNLKSRAAYLGGLPEWEDYNSSAEKLSNHENGLIPELKDSKTGMDYFKKIVSESNKPRLDKLIQDLHMPSDFFDRDTKGPMNKIAYYARLSEGDSFVARLTNRIIAMRKHPIAASMGGGVGLAAGKAVGNAIGLPMLGPFIGFTFGAATAHDLISKYDAAKAIREIGGPSGVMGVRPSANQIPPSNQAPPTSSITPPSSGLGGGGSTSTTKPPVGNTPPGSPPLNSGLSPALKKLLPPSPKEVVRGAGDISSEAKASQAASESGPQGGHAGGGVASVEELNRPGRFVKINRAGIPTDQGKVPDFNLKEGEAGYQVKPDGTYELKSGKETPSTKRGVEGYSKEVFGDKSKVTKVAEGQHGREASKRTGMTKDTPEARRAKARERIAAKREEGTRTQIKGSLEDQARQVAGRMDFQGKSNLELEEGLKELFGENGNRFLKQFQSLARQQKWSEEVYRGYLEDTLDRRAKELAQRPNIPGLGTEPKVE